MLLDLILTMALPPPWVFHPSFSCGSCDHESWPGSWRLPCWLQDRPGVCPWCLPHGVSGTHPMGHKIPHLINILNSITVHSYLHSKMLSCTLWVKLSLKIETKKGGIIMHLLLLIMLHLYSNHYDQKHRRVLRFPGYLFFSVMQCETWILFLSPKW